jgi:hypothetical protein
MNIRLWTVVGAAITCGALLVADAAAQFGGGLGGGMGSSRAGRGGRTGDAATGARESRNERPLPAPDPSSYEQIDYRLSLLQEDLKLSAAQYATWQGFTEKVRAYAMDLARERQRATAAPATSAAQPLGLQAVGQAVDAARNRLTALEDVEMSAKALYPLLNPDQKTLVDMRLPAIVAGRAGGLPPTPGGAANLPDLGSVPRPQR